MRKSMYYLVLYHFPEMLKNMIMATRFFGADD
jgi:hypothetical protein